jgi:hypothetical protein
VPVPLPKTAAVLVPLPKLAHEPLPEPAPPPAPSKPLVPLVPRLDFSPPVPPVPAPGDSHGPLIPDPRRDFYPPLPEVPTPADFKKPPAPPEKSVDDLLNELERVQAQKAELEKKEQELKAQLRKKLEAQTERLKKLGVAPKDAKEPDRVGRITIEGNTKTSDNKILNLLNLRPGQLLRYPALEESRKNLETAGFRGATVEVVPNEIDSTFKDIRVKVDESGSKPKPAPDPLPPIRG